MKFALTGATGFLGRKVVARLLDAGHEVHALGRRRPSDTRAEYFWWDTTKEPMDVSIAGTDVVIHLAGEPVAQRWNDEVKRKIRDSRVLGTRNLVSAIAKVKNPPRVLVSASATGYYGDRGEEILTEQSAPGQGFLSEVCIEWEREALQAENLGLRVALIRTGLVLGPDGGALEQMLPPFRLGLGGKLGDGKQWMSWIHVDDQVSLLLHAAERDNAAGPLNGVAPEPVRNEEFTKTLGQALGRPTILPAPKFGLRLMFGEMADVVTTSQRVIPEATAASGFRWKYTDLGAALEASVR